MRTVKFALGFACAAFIVCALITVVMLISQTVLDTLSNDSASALLSRTKFNEGIRVAAFHTENHEVHKGYAGIELVARLSGMGGENREDGMPVPGGGRERWTNSEFYAELKRVFPQYEITRHSGLRNTELVELIFDSLHARNPVIVFHAAEIYIPEFEYETGYGHGYEYENEDGEHKPRLEMRYSIVSGVELHRDRITLNDPHGLAVRMPLSDFIRSARFEDYEMSFFETVAFAFRIYQKNTVFIVNRNPELPAERT
jgi:hypothetical protein